MWDFIIKLHLATIYIYVDILVAASSKVLLCPFQKDFVLCHVYSFPYVYFAFMQISCLQLRYLDQLKALPKWSKCISLKWLLSYHSVTHLLALTHDTLICQIECTALEWHYFSRAPNKKKNNNKKNTKHFIHNYHFKWIWHFITFSFAVQLRGSLNSDVIFFPEKKGLHKLLYKSNKCLLTVIRVPLRCRLKVALAVMKV